MKLKYKFVVREVDGKPIAVAVGKDNAAFNGMVKLNDSGRFIFELLARRDLTADEIVSEMLEKYEVYEPTARTTVAAFLDMLRQNGLIVE